MSENNWGAKKLKDALKENNIKHGPIKSIGGACSTTFYMADIFDREDVTMLHLLLSDTDIRILKPNEDYYKYYDDPKYQGISDIDLDAEEWDDDDE